MRKTTKYSSAFKESIITKTLAPNGKSVVELSKEFNIPTTTIE